MTRKAKEMEIVSNDLPERISRALETGKCGDWEVLQHLAEHNLVERWTRGEHAFSAGAIEAAIESNFEIRPDAAAGGANP